jgi:hypothetical protein
MNDIPQSQNDINELPQLESFRYENIFNVYKNDTDNYFYNILAKVNFPTSIEEAYYDTYTVPHDKLPYTFISYKLYGTTLLWWLVCSVNSIQTPVFFPKAGTKLKYLKPQYARLVIEQITNT